MSMIAPAARSAPTRKTAQPAVLCDQMVRLAQDADRAGFRIAAEHLAYLASTMLGAPDELRSNQN